MLILRVATHCTARRCAIAAQTCSASGILCRIRSRTEVRSISSSVQDVFNVKEKSVSIPCPFSLFFSNVTDTDLSWRGFPIFPRSLPRNCPWKSWPGWARVCCPNWVYSNGGNRLATCDGQSRRCTITRICPGGR